MPLVKWFLKEVYKLKRFLTQVKIKIVNKKAGLPIVIICTNLMVQVSHIQGHEIRVVLYARLDGGDLLLYRSRLRGLYTDAPPP